MTDCHVVVVPLVSLTCFPLTTHFIKSLCEILCFTQPSLTHHSPSTFILQAHRLSEQAIKAEGLRQWTVAADLHKAASGLFASALAGAGQQVRDPAFMINCSGLSVSCIMCKFLL